MLQWSYGIFKYYLFLCEFVIKLWPFDSWWRNIISQITNHSNKHNYFRIFRVDASKDEVKSHLMTNDQPTKTRKSLTMISLSLRNYETSADEAHSWKCSACTSWSWMVVKKCKSEWKMKIYVEASDGNWLLVGGFIIVVTMSQVQLYHLTPTNLIVCTFSTAHTRFAGCIN